MEKRPALTMLVGAFIIAVSLVAVVAVQQRNTQDVATMRARMETLLDPVEGPWSQQLEMIRETRQLAAETRREAERCTELLAMCVSEVR